MADKKINKNTPSIHNSIRFLEDKNLWAKILTGMFLGLVLGLMLSPLSLALVEEELAFSIGEWVAIPGTLFLGLIQMVIIPLVVCSVILGIAQSGSIDFLKRIGIRIIPYFIATTAISISIGLVLVHVLKPGLVIDQSLLDHALEGSAGASKIPATTFSDLTIPERIENLIPKNPAQAELERNMLQIVIASILVGTALLALPQKSGKAFKDLCESGQVLSMKIISWAMLIAPYAVFGLLCNITIRLGADAIVSVGLYALTVLCGLILMVFMYGLIVRFFSSHSIKEFFLNIKEVQLLAFSTSSSGATMPFTMQASEERLNVKKEVSRVIIPLGATINMDGTALYQAVAALFLCQAFGIELSSVEIGLLLITTIGASIGTPATPGVGIVVLATILTSIGVPAEGIALIIGVDRILDMCRTTINVTGDLTASVVMNKWLFKKHT